MTGQDFPDWVARMIGCRYEIGARGPSSFDCWGVVRYFYWLNYRISLPIYQNVNPLDTKQVSNEMISAENSDVWQEVDIPEHGSLVAMSRSNVFHHVGIWLDIDGGLCLHALDGQSVVAQNMQRLTHERFKRISFFNYGKIIQSNKSR